MQIPSIVSKSTLAQMNLPPQTHAVRIIAHANNNPTTYRLRCRTREYRFERCGVVGKHILDIPLSVWMHGTIVSPFRETNSIADDFRKADNGNFTIHLIPLEQPAKPETTDLGDTAEMLDLLETLILRIADTFDPELTRQNLTPELEEAYKRSGQVAAERLFVKYGRTGIVAFQNIMWPASPAETPAPTNTGNSEPNSSPPGETKAERQARLMREGKERKRLEREAAAQSQ